MSRIHWDGVMFIVSELKIISFEFFFLSFPLPLSPGTIKFTSCEFWCWLSFEVLSVWVRLWLLQKSILRRVLLSSVLWFPLVLLVVFLRAHVVVSAGQCCCSAKCRASVDDQYPEQGSQDTFSQSFVKLKIVHFPNRYFFMFWQDTVKAIHCPLFHWLVLYHSRFYAFSCLSRIPIQSSQQTVVWMLRNSLPLAFFLSFPLLLTDVRIFFISWEEGPCVPPSSTTIPILRMKYQGSIFPCWWLPRIWSDAEPWGGGKLLLDSHMLYFCLWMSRCFGEAAGFFSSGRLQEVWSCSPIFPQHAFTSTFEHHLATGFIPQLSSCSCYRTTNSPQEGYTFKFDPFKAFWFQLSSYGFWNRFGCPTLGLQLFRCSSCSVSDVCTCHRLCSDLWRFCAFSNAADRAHTSSPQLCSPSVLLRCPHQPWLRLFCTRSGFRPPYTIYSLPPRAITITLNQAHFTLSME